MNPSSPLGLGSWLRFSRWAEVRAGRCGRAFNPGTCSRTDSERATCHFQREPGSFREETNCLSIREPQGALSGSRKEVAQYHSKQRHGGRGYCVYVLYYHRVLESPVLAGSRHIVPVGTTKVEESRRIENGS